MSETAELTLYGARTGNCLRAAIGLEEAGLTYAVRHVGLSKGEHGSPAFLALNPAGKVPVLVASQADGAPDFVLSQSNAILFYADECAPGGLLPPGGTGARARALEAFFYFTTDVIALNGVAFALGRQHFDDAAAHLTERYLRAIRDSERFVREEGFMGGDRFSLADIAAYTIVTAVSTQLPWGQLPRLAAWRERVGDRPAVKRGMAAFG